VVEIHLSLRSFEEGSITLRDRRGERNPGYRRAIRRNMRKEYQTSDGGRAGVGRRRPITMFRTRTSNGKILCEIWINENNSATSRTSRSIGCGIAPRGLGEQLLIEPSLSLCLVRKSLEKSDFEAVRRDSIKN